MQQVGKASVAAKFRQTFGWLSDSFARLCEIFNTPKLSRSVRRDFSKSSKLELKCACQLF